LSPTFQCKGYGKNHILLLDTEIGHGIAIYYRL